ncbi:MAG: inositol monophosphatase [Rhodospirillaceae bacterium]|jgi:fructose-1,6-bisphosphatase/inositol monophosphatase family enzyme|nr:inositol monophosphatase [Rhodospirillaceae bacterium]
MTPPELDRVADLMRSVAEEAILPRYRQLAEGDVREKTGPKDLVTVADLESEQLLTPALEALLDGSVVLGEEAAEKDPRLFALLDGDAPVWVVDPIDGTSNFVNGGKLFCVMVALVWRGKTRAGVIFDPLAERWVGAEEGGGAWMHGEGPEPRRMQLDAPTSPSEMEGVLSLRFLEDDLRGEVRARADVSVARHVRLGCAGHEYIRLAENRYQFAVHGKNMPWDFTAGTLIHREAGGFHARFDGRPYHPAELDGGLMAAPDEDSWYQLRKVLFGV